MPLAAPASASRPRDRDVRLIVVSALLGVLFVALQAMILPTTDNMFCAVTSAIAAGVVSNYCLRRSVIERYPVSTIALFGFCVTTFALALVAQSLTWRPLTYNLLVPRETFGWTIVFQAVLLAAHATYASIPVLRTPSRWIAERVLRPLWIFRMPTAMELWALGALGLGATWISRILYVDAVEYGNVGGKFLQALVPYIVSPFFILFRQMFLLRPAPTPRFTVPLLAGYFGVVILTAVFFNARAIFAVVLFTLLLTAFLMVVMGRLTFSTRTKVYIAVGSLALIPLSSIAQDLATAMQIARGLRGSADSAEIAQATMRALGDKDAIARYRAMEFTKTAETGYAGFSEIYIDNEFLQRLSYTKYTDLTMAASLRLAPFQQRLIRQDAIDSIISILPTPLINMLGLEVNKANRSFSTGDVYANLAFNQELGGFRSGSSITNSIDVLDQLWPAVIFLIALVMYMLLDTYSLRTVNGTAISALAFLLMYQIFARGLVYDSFRELVDGITRAYIQAIVVYTMLMLVVRILLAPIVAAVPMRRRGSARLSSSLAAPVLR